LFERAVFPSRTGATKVEIRKGIFKKLDRKAVPATSFEEANCVRIAEKVPWTGKIEDRFYLIRPRNDSEELGVAKEISQMIPYSQGDSPEEKWRREYIPILRKKKQILEEVRPGAVDYCFYRMGGEWHVRYSCHWEVGEVPELTQIEKDLQQLHDLFPGSVDATVFDDCLGDRYF
jgi:hypothetical protein